MDKDLKWGDDELFEFVILEISWSDWRRIIKGINYDMVDPSDTTVKDMGLRPLAFWDCKFESRQGHGVCLLRVLRFVM